MSRNAKKKTIVGILMNVNVNATKQMIANLKSGMEFFRPWYGTKAHALASANLVHATRVLPGMWKLVDVSARFKSVQT